MPSPLSPDPALIPFFFFNKLFSPWHQPEMTLAWLKFLLQSKPPRGSPGGSRHWLIRPSADLPGPPRSALPAPLPSHPPSLPPSASADTVPSPWLRSTVQPRAAHSTPRPSLSLPVRSFAISSRRYSDATLFIKQAFSDT